MYYRTFHDWILKNLPEGSTMLEFGSGPGTSRFVEKFKVYSIEHDIKYLGKEPRSTYVHAPITLLENGVRWYDKEIVLKFVENLEYDLILVDGPTGKIGRQGLKSVANKLKTKEIPIIFDDVNRPAEFQLMNEVAGILDRDYTIFTGVDRKFSVLT